MAQQTLAPITVTGKYSEYTPTGGYFDSFPSSGSNTDLSPVVVTAQKMALPGSIAGFNIAEWFQPPKLFITLGIAAVGIYFVTQKKPTRRRRKRR